MLHAGPQAEVTRGRLGASGPAREERNIASWPHICFESLKNFYRLRVPQGLQRRGARGQSSVSSCPPPSFTRLINPL